MNEDDLAGFGQVGLCVSMPQLFRETSVPRDGSVNLDHYLSGPPKISFRYALARAIAVAIRLAVVRFYYESDDGFFDQKLLRLNLMFRSDPSVEFVTTRDILNEFLAHFSRGDGITRRQAALFVKDIINNPKYRIISIDAAAYWSALELYENRPDKRYSMVDCIGMTIMRLHENPRSPINRPRL